jgi:hypothetical protein
MRPVDWACRGWQLVRVKKKPFIAEEAAAPYAAKKPAKGKATARATQADAPTIRYASAAQAKKAAAEVSKVHEELFRKLAQ